ncbi:ABC transporter substrate binding protein [Rhizobacter sp. P5_C2]
MSINHLSYALGLMAAISIACAVASDTAAAPRRPVIAYIGHWTAGTDRAFQRFVEAMRRRHPDVGANAVFEYVEAPLDDAVLQRAVAAAALRRPDVMVAPTGDSARAAYRARLALPVVFSCYVDPLRAGIVQSMSRPGANMTGISLADTLDGKRLEILRDAAPQVRTVAVLTDPSWSSYYGGEARVQADAARLGMTATILYARDEAEVDALMTRTDASRFDAWYVMPTYVAYVAEQRIIDHIRRLGRYGLFATTNEVRAGGLIGYAQDTSFVWDTLVDLVVRVLDGEDPGSIPVERPKRFVLAVRTGPGTEATPVTSTIIRRADLVF